MSSSLKNKLKRCGRYHTSTPAKKVCPNTLTIDSSPILPTQHLEPSNVSCESLQLKQNDSLSVICEVQENDSPVGLGTSNRSKSVTGHVCSLPSPAAPVFSQSQYSVMNARSSFISPVNKTISGTPSSSKRNRRRLIRSTKLNFDKSDLKTNVESKDDEPKLDLNVGEQSLSKPSCSTNLNDVSQLMAGNKKEFVCNTFTYEKESSTVCGVLKSKIPKDVSSQSQQLVISKQTLLQEIKEKKETLRKLKMVKMYRSKVSFRKISIKVTAHKNH